MSLRVIIKIQQILTKLARVCSPCKNRVLRPTSGSISARCNTANNFLLQRTKNPLWSVLYWFFRMIGCFDNIAQLRETVVSPGINFTCLSKSKSMILTKCNRDYRMMEGRNRLETVLSMQGRTKSLKFY